MESNGRVGFMEVHHQLELEERQSVEIGSYVQRPRSIQCSGSYEGWVLWRQDDIASW